eukprot:1955379-Amphidinium_carterae.1
MLGFTVATHQPNTVDNCVVIGRSRTLCNGTSHNGGTAHQASDSGDDNTKLSRDINMSINTDSSARKAVASRLGLNKKTKH